MCLHRPQRQSITLCNASGHKKYPQSIADCRPCGRLCFRYDERISALGGETTTRLTRILMTRTTASLAVIALVLLVAPFAYANDWYDYDRYEYDYDYRSYDNSIYHSFNNYDSFNYSYGYPYYTSYDYNYGYNNYGYNNYGYKYDYHRKPTCSISTYRTNGTYPYDDSVTLSWWSSNATSAYLSNVGSVNTSGSQVVYGTHYTTYTLTVSGPGGSTSCSASSPFYDSGSNYHKRYSYQPYNYVTSPVFSYPVYSYPYVSGTVYPTSNYVTLTQVPYTGFDYGIVGNSLYWLGMILLAAFGAYLIVYSRSGMLPRAFVREVAVAARNQARFVKSLIR